MKKFILFIALMLTIAIASAQTFKAPSRSKQSVKSDTTTTYRYEVKDTVYTVYKSPRGAFYIWKRTKNGNIRKIYLPKEVQIQMGRVYTKED